MLCCAEPARAYTTSAMNHLSHISGFFYRTIRMVEGSIKPVYVFDGKPPDLKAKVVSEGCEQGSGRRLGGS